MPGRKKTAKKAAKKRRAPARFSISTADLQSPQVAGFASRCAIIDRGLVLELVFFEERPPKTVYTVARVMATIDMVIDRLWEPSIAFYESQRKVLQETEIQTKPVAETPPEDSLGEPKPAVMCNVFRIARTGMEAVLDLHYISPGDIHLLQEERRIPTVVPVMRIQTTLPVIIGIFEFLEPMLGELKARLGRS